MLNKIEYRNAIQVKKAITTKGSAPLRVLCDDGEIYYIKTTLPTHPPFAELINELLCNYLCQTFNLKAAIPRLIILPQVVVDSFLNEGGTLDKRYKKVNFDTRIFFGVKIIDNATEFEEYNYNIKNKHEYNKFNAPIDLIKIGVFDFWIGNKDRRPENPNIIISPSEDGFVFNPIDHAAAFGYETNYKGLKESQLRVDSSKNILSTPISKSILKFAISNNNDTLHKDILDNISNSLDNLDFIFDQIPNNWGFSKSGKSKVKKVLSNIERNKIISKAYYRFIKT